MKESENNVNMFKSHYFILISYYFHIFLHILEPRMELRSQNGGGPGSRARPRAWPMPPFWALGLGPGPTNVSNIK